jgi:hypothetical protein
LDGSLIPVGNPELSVSRGNLVDTRYHCPAALEYSSHLVTISTTVIEGCNASAMLDHERFCARFHLARSRIFADEDKILRDPKIVSHAATLHRKRE